MAQGTGRDDIGAGPDDGGAGSGARDLGGPLREPDGVVDGLPGGGPPCAICARGGEGPRRLVHLTHGVAVWLCHTHGDDRFLRTDDGTVFAERLLNMWLATGSLMPAAPRRFAPTSGGFAPQTTAETNRGRTRGLSFAAKLSCGSRPGTTRAW